MSASQTSRNEEELVEKAASVLNAWSPGSNPACEEMREQAREEARQALDAIDLSSILRERDEAEADRAYARAMWHENGKEAEKAWTEVFALRARLEAAEGERDAALAKLNEALTREGQIAGERNDLRGERDRLLRKVELMGEQAWCERDRAVAQSIAAKARAALSTGDRQDDDFGVRTGAPTQPGIAGQDSEGGPT